MADNNNDIVTDETLPDLKAKEVEEAKKQGALDAVRESAAQQFKSTDGVSVAAEEDHGVTPDYAVAHLEHRLELAPDAIKAWLTGKDGASPSQGQVAGLLESERSGQNRTDVVETLCKFLGVKTAYEVTDAGPGYTNDVSRNVVKRG